MFYSIKGKYTLYAAVIVFCAAFTAQAAPQYNQEKAVEHQQKVSYLSFGTRLGKETVEGYTDLIYPLFATASNTFFLSPRFSLTDEGANEANIGFGYRRKLNNWLVGGTNVYFDSRESEHGNRFNQWGAGLELFSEYVDVRANYYDADNDKQRIGEYRQRVTETSTQLSYGNDGQPFAIGHEIITEKKKIEQTTITVIDKFFEQFEAGMDGWDAEIGGKLPLPKGPEIRLFAGYYDYDNPLGDDFSGGKGRLEVKTGSWLALDAEVYEDEALNDTSYFVGFRLQLPLTSDLNWQGLKDGLFSSQHRDLDQRMRSEMVARDVRVQTGESSWQEDLTRRQVQRRVSEKRSTIRVVLADHITFVDGDTSGVEDGTNERPYKKIQDGVDNAGANNTIFVYETGGTATGRPGAADGGSAYDEQVVLQEGQTLTSTVSWTSHGGGSYQTKQRPIIKPTAVNREESIVRNGNTFSFAPVVSMAADATVRRMAIDATEPTFAAYNTDTYHVTSGIFSNRGDTDGDSLLIENNTITASGRRTRGIWIDGYGAKNLSSTIVDNHISTGSRYTRGIWLEGGNSDNLSSTITKNTINTVGSIGTGIHIAIDDSTGLSSLVAENRISTTGRYGHGINLTGRRSTNLSSTTTNNTITTSGSQAHGIRVNADLSTDLLSQNIGNIISTIGKDSQGIRFKVFSRENQTFVAVNNTISTSGVGADGIYLSGYRATHLSFTAMKNKITSNADNAHGIQVTGEADASITNSVTENNLTINGGAWGIEINDDVYNSFSENTLRNNNAFTLGSSALGDVIVQ